MRTAHTPHSFPAFPVYSSSFLSENELVLGGGGGQGKNGVKNKLIAQRLFKVGTDRSLDPITEIELQLGEDAPMSMAADNKVLTTCLQLVKKPAV
ncbi:hypothetical protein H0H87_001164 [Tephrocybe sp. NHM501043]|nr:hypothetical protein H0H87_001164 [Tephrocybe sp. NHM501043]